MLYVLICLPVLTHCFSKQPLEVNLSLAPFYRQGEEGTDSSSDLVMITWLVSSGDELEPRQPKSKHLSCAAALCTRFISLSGFSTSYSTAQNQTVRIF